MLESIVEPWNLPIHKYTLQSSEKKKMKNNIFEERQPTNHRKVKRKSFSCVTRVSSLCRLCNFDDYRSMAETLTTYGRNNAPSTNFATFNNTRTMCMYVVSYVHVCSVQFVWRSNYMKHPALAATLTKMLQTGP